MLKVTLLICSIANPQNCVEHTTTAHGATPFACYHAGMVYAASRGYGPPKWRVKKFTCKRFNLMDGVKEKLREKARQGPQENPGGNPEAVR